MHRARRTTGLGILRSESSLRGMAAIRGINRETFRTRFHRSLKHWYPPSLHELLPGSEPLVAVSDALWFRYGNGQVRYCCYVIVLRPIAGAVGSIASMTVRSGKETRMVWDRLFDTLPASIRRRIVALVSDGLRGMHYVAADRGWHFQSCQVHLKRKMAELRGVRKLPGREIRREITDAVHQFLNTPDAEKAQAALKTIYHLFAHLECPRSIRSRLAALMHTPYYFRTCWEHPELRLPASTNSVECINGALRRILARVRGFSKPRHLRTWIRIFHAYTPTIMCRDVYTTSFINRNSMS